MIVLELKLGRKFAVSISFPAIPPVTDFRNNLQGGRVRDGVIERQQRKTHLVVGQFVTSPLA